MDESLKICKNCKHYEPDGNGRGICNEIIISVRAVYGPFNINETFGCNRFSGKEGLVDEEAQKACEDHLKEYLKSYFNLEQ